MLAPLPFTGETFSQKENRINYALFSLIGVPVIRGWLLNRLSLPSDCIIYPPTNIRPSDRAARPDFVVINADDSVAAWIEVEVGKESNGQLAAYRAAFAEPVKSIVGMTIHGGDVSLEEIACAITELRPELDRQQCAHSAVFTALVSSLSSDSCAVPGCGQPITGRSLYCKKHHMRWRRHGDPTITLKPHGKDPARAYRPRTGAKEVDE